MVTGRGSKDAKARKPPPAKQESNQARQDSPGIPGMDLIKSLQHTERDVFYSTYWEDACLPAVHPMFKSISLSAWNRPMLRDAILALSSCHLSRLNPDRRSLSSSNMVHTGTFSPNLVHQTRSQLYYSSATKKFITMDRTGYHSDAMIAFTVIILFAYIECSMGNFQGFYCHVQGLANSVMELRQAIGNTTLKALLAACMQVRYVVWWARVYFSALDVHLELPSVPLPKVLEGSFGSIQERRVMALSIMCESHRLNFKEALSHWSSQFECNELNYLQLAEEAKKSDEWLLHLPPSEQPLDSRDPDCNLDNSNAPIYFQSHDAALNFAYYVVGRIMQCTSSLRQLQNQNTHQYEYTYNEEEPWVHLLLRIAKGTNIQTSISRNSYTIGFSGLLLAAILRCQSLSLGIEIQEWLETLQAMQPTEEGAFPVYQTLGVVKAIIYQRMMGREIYGVTLPVDDGGGTPKFTAYNSQPISTLLLHGRCRVSNEFFTKCAFIGL